MRVAICITTHNRRADLSRTLDRISELSPQPDELLIVADGCTDDTVALVKNKVPHATLIEHMPGRGSVASRNALAALCKSEVFLSLDDDSYPLEPDALARIAGLFEKNMRLAVASFPQRSDEWPATLTQTDFGTAHFLGSYANCAAAVRRSAFEQLCGYYAPFFHIYEEPDFALRCCAAGWQVRFEPVVTIRHHWTSAQRSEVRNHQRHARNELWSVLLRCPMPQLLGVLPFRIFRQAAYAAKRGVSWLVQEPKWWWAALLGLGACFKNRAALPWPAYRAWMNLVRQPHDDHARWERDFPRP